jgi:hypothetical protein
MPSTGTASFIKRTAESRREHTARFMCQAQGKGHKPASKMTMLRSVTGTIKHADSQDHTQSSRGQNQPEFRT